jgi:hypothetical protein
LHASDAQREIDLARGLAAEWGFAELAQRVVDGLAARASARRDVAELELLRCELFASAARRDGTRRAELARQSLEGYRAFLERSAGDAELADLASAAEVELARAAAAHVRSLALELFVASDEEAAALRAELRGWAEDALQRGERQIAQIERVPAAQRSATDQQRLHELRIGSGEMALDLARAAQDPAAALERARAEFEAVIEEAGEGSPASLRAFAGLGEVELAQGRFEPAARSLRLVVELAIPREASVWRAAREEMPPAELERRFLFVQLATAGLVDALVQAGQPAEALAWGLHFSNTWRLEQLELQRPIGDLSLLALARALLGAGGFVGGDWSTGTAAWFETRAQLEAAFPAQDAQFQALDVALALGEVVEDRNRGTALGLRARRAIDGILALPAIEFEPGVLLESAQAALAADEPARAIGTLERALAALDRAPGTDRARLASEVLWTLGRCQRLEQRPLEAAQSFQTALERYRGDPELDLRHARELHEVARALRRERAGDPGAEETARSAEELAAQVDPEIAGELAFARAQQAFAAEDYEQAAELFASVPAAARDRERALAFSGACAFHLGQLERAESLLADYLERYLRDPAQRIDPGDAERRARRAEAEATAVFYRGACAFERAEAGAGEPQWQLAVELLQGFETRFPAQSGFAPAALHRLALAYEHLERPADARRARELLAERFPQDRWTSRAQAEVYRALEQRLAQAMDDATRSDLLRAMAESLRASNRASTEPFYDNLKLEAEHWLELEEWAAAEEVLARAAELFSAQQAGDVERQVLPKLAEARLLLGKPAAAAEVLAPLVEGGKATRRTVRLHARALAGWVEAVATPAGGRIEVRTHPGVGGAESLRKASELLRQLAESAEPWSVEWFECEFDRLYAALEASRSDPAQLESVRVELELLGGEVRLGPRLEHPNLSAPLRQKYLWLRERVR